MSFAYCKLLALHSEFRCSLELLIRIKVNYHFFVLSFFAVFLKVLEEE